jgi:hypothetical protein
MFNCLQPEKSNTQKNAKKQNRVLTRSPTQPNQVARGSFCKIRRFDHGVELASRRKQPGGNHPKICGIKEPSPFFCKVFPSRRFLDRFARSKIEGGAILVRMEIFVGTYMRLR